MVFEIANKRWRRIFSACGVLGIMSLVALSRMPSGWLHSYQENLRYFFAIGDVNDFTTRNPSRFDLLNLQPMLYFVTRAYALTNILSWAIAGGLLVLWWRHRRLLGDASLASIVLIGLLPVYQRTYNAGVIALLLPYAISRWPEIKGKLLIAGCGVFLIPGPGILATLHQRYSISDNVWNNSWWFNLIVGPHSTWGILLMIVVLLVANEDWRLPDSPKAFRGTVGKLSL